MLLVENVQKSFRLPDGTPLPILNVPRFEVAAGEQLALVGGSGSGKTTLLHIIAGISRPDSGRVQINGTDITQLNEVGRDMFRANNIGYIFQTFNLLAGFSALENVLLGMSFCGRKPDEARAKHLLERVGLGKRFDHKPSMLSVGEQQAHGRGSRAGESPEGAAGRRTDGEHRCPTPTTSARPSARHLPRGERRPGGRHARRGSERAVSPRRAVGRDQQSS